MTPTNRRQFLSAAVAALAATSGARRLLAGGQPSGGLRAIDVRTLTEAAESLGAGWPTILFRVIFPNVRVAILSGAFLTFAIVIGEFTMASLLDRPAFGPYLQLIGANRAYEPAALAIIAFIVTWACMGLIQVFGRGKAAARRPAGR